MYHSLCGTWLASYLGHGVFAVAHTPPSPEADGHHAHGSPFSFASLHTLTSWPPVSLHDPLAPHLLDINTSASSLQL
jgi:hypothetical protein